MKIVHVCLAAFYVEGLGYQENILPQLHAEMGNEVSVLTSDYSFNSKYETIKRDKTDYINSFGIHVKVLDKTKRYGKYSKYGDFSNVYDELVNISPDTIFVHGGQFIALKDVLKYCKRNRNVKLYIDQHGDYYNTPVDTWRRKLAQKIIFGHWMRKAIKYTEKFWGVTPWRCQYLHEVYGIPENKIGLLVMGGDDRYIHFDQASMVRENIRQKLSLDKDDFVIISGGKIDKGKNIHILMQAISEIDNDRIKLIVFGQPNDEMEPIIDEKALDKNIRHIGWLDSTSVYDYFLASDLAVFPGTHSVLWEQACSCGLPGLFKDWEGMRHVNVEDNADFLYNDCVEEIKQKITELYTDKDKYSKMKDSAKKVAVEFSYRNIAKKSIGIEK